MKKARVRVKIAPKTRQQPIANVPHHVTLAVRAEQHQTEACLVRNVWLANSKKRQTRTKKFVPLVRRAITRTRQTWTRASNVHVGMPNRRPNKRRALNAVLVNSMVMLVWLHVNRARKTRITGTKGETALASIVPWGGRPPVAVPNAKRAVRGRSVMVATSAHWDLQEKEVTLMRRNADNVPWGKQRRMKVRPRAVAVI